VAWLWLGGAALLLALAGPAHAEEVPFGGQQVISTQVDGPRSIAAADLDGDGDADLVVASSNDSTIAWLENTGGAFGSPQEITQLASLPYSVAAADVDGDGDLDVLSGSALDDEIAWYENTDGAGSFGSQQLISTLADQAQDVAGADLDRDGDVDVLSAPSATTRSPGTRTPTAPAASDRSRSSRPSTVPSRPPPRTSTGTATSTFCPAGRARSSGTRTPTAPAPSARSS
jgi:hypothetical protein